MLKLPTEHLNAALGYICHFIKLASLILDIKLPSEIEFFGSKSLIEGVEVVEVDGEIPWKQVALLDFNVWYLNYKTGNCISIEDELLNKMQSLQNCFKKTESLIPISKENFISAFLKQI